MARHAASDRLALTRPALTRLASTRSPGESESTCMIACSQLGCGTVGVSASAAGFAKFEEYLDIGELGFVIVASVHRVPILPCEMSLAHFIHQCLTQMLFASAAEMGVAQKRLRGVVVDALPVGVVAADADPAQRRIDTFFAQNP